MNNNQLETSKIVNLSEFNLRDKNLFYVYSHKTLDENITFYIGKGRGNRCGNISTRTYWWKNIVAKHGYYIEIIALDLTEKEAFNIECDLINSIGRRNIKTGTLVNLTDGGLGASGKVYTLEEKESARKRMLFNDSYKRHGNRSEWFGKSRKGEENPNFSNRRGRKLVPVVRLDLNLENPIFYSTAEQAMIDNDVAFNSLWYCCTGKRNQLKGYIYFKTVDYESGNYSKNSGITNSKKIAKLCIKTGKIISIYDSINSVSKDGYGPQFVGSVIRGRGKTAYGYKWKYL